jgi:hypothetical protein
MSKIIECACGAVLRADNDQALVTAAQNHAKAVHDLVLTDDQAMAMARPE